MVEIASLFRKDQNMCSKAGRQGPYLTHLQKILSTIYLLDKLLHAETDTVGASQ